MRPARLILLLAALALVSGCRFAIDHVHDGLAPDPARLERLAAGRSSLDDALAALGAPDGVEWVEREDVLVYVSVSSRATRWTLENPFPWLGGTGGLHVISLGQRVVTSTILSTTGRSGSRQRGRGGATRPTISDPRTTTPLTLDGDVAGREEVRLFFDRASGLLTEIEVASAGPTDGPVAVAGDTFLR